VSAAILAALGLVTAAVVLATAITNRKLTKIEVRVDGRLEAALDRIDELKAVIVTSDKEIPPGPHDVGTWKEGER
jgi:hypothetical protein